MSPRESRIRRLPSLRGQRGVTTLMVTLAILVILTIIILASSNVALFEQKTATNEMRQRLAEQAAEYALNIGGEYVKANVSKVSTTASGGWLNAGSLRWRSCAGITDSTHPCFAEPDSTVRAKMYYYTSDGLAHTSGSAAELNLFSQVNGTSLLPAGSLTTMGGTGAFPATATVKALMCRVNSPTGGTPTCELSPTAGRRIAITLVAEGSLTNENATAVVKETWGTITNSSFAASTPLVASGFIQFVGNYTVVDAPAAGGKGANAAVWSPNDVDGNGSFQTCQRHDYINGMKDSMLATDPGCADNSSCDCDTEILTSKFSDDGEDVLDADGGEGVLPDITFFPGHNAGGTRMDYRATGGACPADHLDCFTDDNLFEWIFGVDVTGVDGSSNDDDVVNTDCTYPVTFAGGGTDCEVAALHDLDFQTISNCDGLSATSSGMYYVTTPDNCDLPDVVGSPESPVVLVVDTAMTVGHSDLFYGMVFVRDPTYTNSAEIKGNAKGMFFGSIVIEGGGKLNGNMDLIYLDTSAGNPDDPLPESTRFARLPGSWLDNSAGF